jgi:hypothetical protein
MSSDKVIADIRGIMTVFELACEFFGGFFVHRMHPVTVPRAGVVI